MILTEYASTLGAEEPFTGKRLSMTVDDTYRLQLLERKDGRILVRSRLRGLPEAGPKRNATLEHCARLVCGRMLSAPVACAVDAQERTLWLQQICTVSTTQDLDDRVGAFVNELAFWVSALKD